MPRTRTLFPLNGQLLIAGETFFSHQVGLDLDDRILYIQHPALGELKLRPCDLEVGFLDLEIPALLRMLSADQGWTTLTLHQLFDLVLATRNAQEG